MQPSTLPRLAGALASLPLLLALAPAAGAQVTLTWTGAVDGDWNNAFNWSGGGIPGPTDIAIVPAGTPNTAQAVFGDVSVGSVQVNSGAVIGIQDGRKITINDNLTCNGAVNAFGSGQLLVENNVVVSSATASFSGLATIELQGDGTVTANAAVLLPELTVTGGVRELASGRSAGLFLDQGPSLPTVELRVANGGLFTVDGNAFLSAPVTSPNFGASIRTLVINGTTTWDVPNYPPGSEQNSAFVLRANGDWEASTPTTIEAGWIEMGGAGTHVIRTFFGSVSLAIFNNLRIVEGTRLLENKNVRVLGELEVRNATFDLDWPEFIEVEGTLDTNWAGASLVNKDLGATVPVRLTGTGDLSGGVNPLPELEILGGVRTNTSATTAEDVTLAGGSAELKIANGTTLHVLDTFQHNNGTLRFDAFGGSTRILRVDGLFQQFGGIVVSPSGADRIEVSGDWVSQSGYVLDSGWVYFTGSGQLSGGAPQIKRMRLSSGVREVVNDVEVFGELLSLGGSTSGSGWVVMTDTITPVNTGANLINRLRVAAGGVDVTTTRVGTLEVVGGILRILNGVALTVDGDARFLGGQFSSEAAGASIRYLDVAGDFLEGGTTVGGQQNAATELRVAGNWTGGGSFVLPLGWVRLDGAGSTVIDGADPTFGNLRIENGTRTLAADTEATQELEVRSSLDIAARDLIVQGTLDSNWAGASIVGDGPIQLTGDGDLITNTTSIPPLTLVAGTRLAMQSYVDELRIAGGKWFISNATTCTVAGDALLEGGQIESDPFGGSVRGFDVNGNLIQSGTTIDSGAAATVIRVAGDWASESGFLLEEGWVYLDGGDSEIGGPNPTFKRLRLDAGVNTLTSEVEVTGELFAQAGSTAGTPWLNVTDALAPVQTGVNEIARLRVASGVIPFTTTRCGDLEVAGGTLRLLNGVALTVTGDVTFVAGQFASEAFGGSIRFLDVAGDFIEIGTTAAAEQNGATEIRVAGDWVGDGLFTLPSGWVRLDGAAATTVGGSGPVFGNLRIETGARTLTTDVVVEQELEVRSALDIVDRDLEVVGTLDSNWAGATLVGDGPVRLTGDGALTTTVNSIAPVRVDGGLRQVSQSYVDAMELAGGTWRMMNGTTCTVAGDAVFSSGTLESELFGGSIRGFDINGALTHTFTTVDVQNPATIIRVAGDWSSDFLFDMEQGWVYLDGGDATVGGPGAIFKRLRLDSGVKTLVDQVEVYGELFAQAGSTAGTEYLVLTDALTPVFTGANKIANLRVAGGDVHFTTTRAGNFQLVGGVMRHLNGVVITVDGNAEFSGGVFESDPFGGSTRIFDVAGDFTAIAATVNIESAVQRFRVAGDWASNSSFILTQGVVELDGSGDSFLRGSVPGNDPYLPTLEIKNGRRLVDDAVELVANQVTVFNGGRLESAAGGELVAVSVPFTVDGTLAASAGGRLSLGSGSSILVNGGGRLELIGTLDDPAVLGGVGGGGYACTVNGVLAARDFVVSQPGEDGLVMNGTYAAAPNDLRGGEFASPAPTGTSTLLTLGHGAAKTFFFVRFEDTALTGTYNVRRTAGADVAFQNFGGDFSGELFEDDPGDRIDWLPPAETEITFFTATNGPERVRLDWETSFEADVDAFILEAGPTASGPFATVVELPPTGVGGYTFTDQPLTPDVDVFYRLLERRTDNFVRLLAEDSATPYSAGIPANVRTVGPTGEFSTIQAAIDAASAAFTVIRVAPGTYDAFTIASPTAVSLSIVPEGPGVIVDASLAPVAISGVGFGQDVVLCDLSIVGGTGDAALELANNFGAVIVDRCDVSGGAGQPGLDSSLSLAVSLQDCDLSGTPGVLGLASGLYVGRGSIDTLQAIVGSTVRLCGLTPGAQAGDGSETVTSYPGVSPQLTAPRYQSLGEPFSVDVNAAPTAFYQLAASATSLPLDLGDPDFWQMVLLLDSTLYFELGEGFTDGSGDASVALTLPPEGGILGARLLVQGWTVQVVPTVEVRFSGAQPLIAMP